MQRIMINRNIREKNTWEQEVKTKIRKKMTKETKNKNTGNRVRKRRQNKWRPENKSRR